MATSPASKRPAARSSRWWPAPATPRCAASRRSSPKRDLPDELADLADDDEGFEALFQVTGQQGADLSERLLVARERR